MIPVLLFIPLVVSGFHLVAEMVSGELSRLHLALLTIWFLVAAYLQFSGGSTALFITGLLAQVILAIVLRIRLTLMQARK